MSYSPYPISSEVPYELAVGVLLTNKKVFMSRYLWPKTHRTFVKIFKACIYYRYIIISVDTDNNCSFWPQMLKFWIWRDTIVNLNLWIILCKQRKNATHFFAEIKDWEILFKRLKKTKYLLTVRRKDFFFAQK